MKKIVYTLSILFFMCFNAQAQSMVTISLDSVEDGTKFYFSPGQLVKVKASANITTGYSWTADYNKKLVRLAHEGYASDPVPEGWVGGGGTAFFDFEMLAKGNSTLSFLYSRNGQDGQPKKLHIICHPVNKASLLGPWIQTNYSELVVRDGVKYPHDTTYTKGEHTFIFNSNKKGVSKDFNSETGLIEESSFKWTLKKNILKLQYLVSSKAQDSFPEVYTVSPSINGVILESMKKENDSNFTYSKLILKR